MQRWQALLGEFGASDDVAGPMRARAAVAHLRELAATRRIRAAGDRGAAPRHRPGDQPSACGSTRRGSAASRRRTGPRRRAPTRSCRASGRCGSAFRARRAELAEAEARRTLQRLSHGPRRWSSAACRDSRTRRRCCRVRWCTACRVARPCAVDGEEHDVGAVRGTACARDVRRRRPCPHSPRTRSSRAGRDCSNCRPHARSAPPSNCASAGANSKNPRPASRRPNAASSCTPC